MTPEFPVAPDVAGAMRAYRSWGWDRRRGLMSRSYKYEDTWKRAEARGTCPNATPDAPGLSLLQRWLAALNNKVPELRQAALSHKVPGITCRCGLYGCTSPRSPQISSGGVHGVIECWGGVCVGDRNTVIRAEYARIVAVYFSWLYFTRRDVTVFRQLYPGVPVYHSYKKMMADFPPADGKPGRARHWWSLGLFAAWFAGINWQIWDDLANGHVKLPDVLNSVIAIVLVLAWIRWTRRR